MDGEFITMHLKLIPNEEILSKFLKTNFELLSGENTPGNNSQYK